MKAEAYKKLVDGRIEKLKGHLEQGLEKRSLSPEQKSGHRASRWTAPSRSCTRPWRR